jgi:hypothetical protein
MSGEHANKELITGEKVRIFGEKMEATLCQRRSAISIRRTRMNPPAPSNHRRATRRKRR